MKSSLVFLVLILQLGIQTSNAQQRRVDEPISDELYELLTKRADAIKSELSGETVNEWAGTYSAGDHHPTMFMWSPANGFIVTSSLHTFSPSWVNLGKVKFEPNLLTLFPELAEGEKSAHILPNKFRTVLWGDWRFLIPTDQILEFAYAVHSGSESQLWNFFVKPGNRESERKGLPDLPTEYLKIMTMPAVRARVLRVTGSKDDVWGSEITLDVGRNKNVFEGMCFYYANGLRKNIQMRVERVAESTSTARISMIGGTDDGDMLPKVGMKFASKMPKGFIEPGE